MFILFLSLCTGTGAYNPHCPLIWTWEVRITNTRSVMIKLTMGEQHQVFVDFCYFMPFLEVVKNTAGMVVGTYLLREKYRKSSSMQAP